MRHRHAEGDPLALIEYGRRDNHIWHMAIPCLIGIVTDETVAIFHGVAGIGRQQAFYGFRIKHRMILNTATDHDDLAVRVGQPSGAVLTFPQNRRIAGMKQRMRHPLGCFAYTAQDNLRRNRIKTHASAPVSMMRLPHGSTEHFIPAKITVVESNC